MKAAAVVILGVLLAACQTDAGLRAADAPTTSDPPVSTPVGSSQATTSTVETQMPSTATSVAQSPQPTDSQPETTGDGEVYLRSCGRIASNFPRSGAVGPVFMNIAENDDLPVPNDPDGWRNTIKMPLTVSGDAVGPIEVSVSPEEDIRLRYYEEDPFRSLPFEDLDSRLRIEACDDLHRWYIGGVVVRGPGCYTLSVSDLGTGERFEREFPIGNVGCEGYPDRVMTFPGAGLFLPDRDQFLTTGPVPALALTMGIVDDDLLVMSHGDGGGVHAVDIASGEGLWTTERFSTWVGLLAVDGDSVYVAGEGLVIALDRESGDEVWRVDLSQNMTPLGGMAVDDTLHIVFNRDRNDGTVRSRVISLATEDGSRLSEAALDGPREAMATPEQATMVSAGRRLLVGTSQGLYSVNTASGELAWRVTFSETSQPGSAPIVVDDGVVFAARPQGELVAFDVGSGETQWRVKAAGRVFPVGVINDELVYVDGDGVHRLEAATGEATWHYSVQNVCGSRTRCKQTAVIDGTTVYLYQPRVVTAIDGVVLWRRSVDERSPASLKVLDGSLVVAAGEDAIHGLDATTGEVAWVVPRGSTQPLYTHQDHLVVLHWWQTAAVYDPWVR